MSTRTRGTLVFPIDPDLDQHRSALYGGDRYAVGINPHTGETFLIHSEGVIYTVGHNEPWRFNDNNVFEPFFTVIQVRSWREGVEPVDLADWVRSFGARLESNFHTCHTLLNSTMPLVDSADDHEIRTVISTLDPYEVPVTV